LQESYERTWETRREGGPKGGGRSAGDEARADYYGVPPIHKSHWNWLIITYFFCGGLSGASYAIASIAGLFGDRESRRIARVGRYLSFAALLPSPILLILDLGRPDRFHHMLRVVKVRSPMSVGVWALLLFSGFCSLSAAVQAAQDGLLGRTGAVGRALQAIPARTVGALGLGSGLALAGYAGPLLAATAVPLWTKNGLMMGPLFLASSMSSATAAIALILALARGTHHTTLARLERLDTLALLTEGGLLLATHLRLGPTIGRPLVRGRLGLIHHIGVLGLGLAAPIVLQSRAVFRGERPSRPKTMLASILVLVGGVLFRYVIVTAGNASASDPRATFELAAGSDPTS